MTLSFNDVVLLCRKVNKGQHYSSITVDSLQSYIEKLSKNKSGGAEERKEREKTLLFLNSVLGEIQRGISISDMIDPQAIAATKDAVRAEVLMLEGTPQEKAELFFQKEHRELRQYTCLFTKEELADILTVKPENAKSLPESDQFDEKFDAGFIQVLKNLLSSNEKSVTALLQELKQYASPFKSLETCRQAVSDIVVLNEKGSRSGKISESETAALCYRDKLLPCAAEFIAHTQDKREAWKAVACLLTYPALTRAFRFDYTLDSDSAMALISSLQSVLHVGSDREVKRIVRLVAPRYRITLPAGFGLLGSDAPERKPEQQEPAISEARYSSFMARYAKITYDIEHCLTAPVDLKRAGTLLEDYQRLMLEYPEFDDAEHNKSQLYLDRINQLTDEANGFIDRLVEIGNACTKHIGDLHVNELQMRAAEKKRMFRKLHTERQDIVNKARKTLKCESEFDSLSDALQAQYTDREIITVIGDVRKRMDALESAIKTEERTGYMPWTPPGNMRFSVMSRKDKLKFIFDPREFNLFSAVKFAIKAFFILYALLWAALYVTTKLGI